jgi:SPP1 gp7 family putative phage head morphogenesis protein
VTANPNAEIFKRLLSVSRGARAARPKTLPRVVPPKAIEADFFRSINRYLDEALASVLRALEPELRTLVAEGRVDSAVRLDASRLNTLLDRVSKEFFEKLKPEEIERLAAQIAGRTIQWDKQETAKQVRAAFGVDVLSREPQLARQTNGFISEAVALIKSIPNKFFDDVEASVARAVNAGTRPEEIAREIQKQHGISERRAALIARDQVGKFFGNVNKARQKSMGVTHYIWRTSNDERVRPDHAEREGQTFSWDEPPPDGHPGIAVSCRCFGEPILAPLLGDDEPVAQQEDPAQVEVEDIPPDAPAPSAAPTLSEEPTRTGAVRSVFEDADENASRMEREVLTRMRAGKLSAEELARARDRLDNPLTINFDPQNLPGISLDGFKSQADRPAGTEGALESAAARRAADAAVFGREVPNPVTAAVNINNDPRGGANGYGEAFVVLRDEVRDRATLTPRDTGGDGAAMRGKTVPARNPDGLLAERPDLGGERDPRGYVEAQIFGGVRVADMKELHLPGTALDDPNVRRAAERMRDAGVRVVIHDRLLDREYEL